MMGGWRRPISWAIGAAVVCLIGAASLRAQATPAAQGSLMTEAVFENIQVLKGIPVDTFLDVMGMFAASMGDDCTYCHVKDAVTDRAKFAEATPRLQRARQMILMTRAINNANFGGVTRVTCFTCHRGAYRPVTAPKLALQYGTPEDDPNVIDFIDEPNASAQTLFDEYFEALGGADDLAEVTSFVAKGTYAGFDTGFGEVPVEIHAKAPDQRAWTVHMIGGDSRRIFDGSRGWIAGIDTPTPVMPLTSGHLDVARLEALVAFPLGIPKAFEQWKVGTLFIDDREVRVAQGSRAGLLPVNFYFDIDSGLLVRIVRWNDTPLGPVPTQIEYDDYRDVGDIRMPFTWTVTQTYMQMTVTLSEVDLNAAVDASQFNAPTLAASR